MNLNALFFAAHPDDAELGCGGTIRNLVKLGKLVGIIDLTEGELGTRGTKQTRRREALQAAKVLGVHVRENLKIPDGNIENNSKNRLKIIKAVRKYRPDIIFIPHYYDRHPDHYNTNFLVKDAAFYAGLTKIKTGGLSSHRPRRSFYYMQSYTFEPNIIVDISSTFADKMKAVSCYQSQFYNPKSKEPVTFVSDKKFMKFIEARAEFYGFQIGVSYGEPFYTEGKIKINPKELFNI